MWPNPQETEDLVTFTEESLMENFIFFLYSDITSNNSNFLAAAL